ncbi:hypothetical protein SEPCBS119000_000881 [Sporothrix epigloea]|uniref:CN hydrolase domain-containing protein n=1 Tax=Sporothrix epigloea TaxID=1892477 RepID=A0ABP0DAV2_9PEZI
MAKIRLGTCSPPAAESLASSLLVLERLVIKAASKGVDLLLLPEAFLGGGYPRGGSCPDLPSTADQEALFDYNFQQVVDFGDIVVDDAGAGGGTAWINRDEHLHDDEFTGDGTRETLERIARQTGVFLVVGAIEKAERNLYCAVVYVCPQKGVLGKRRKLQPTPQAGHKGMIWSAVGRAALQVISTDIKGVHIRLAAAISGENYMPLLRQSVYAQDINLYLATTTESGDAWLSLARTIGIEGCCFVMTSSMSKTAPGRALRSKNAASTSPSPIDSKSQMQTNPITTGTVFRTNGSGVTTKTVTCAASCPGGKPRRRKKSFVLDEYGNEIVLSCETVVEDDLEAAKGNVNGTSNAASDAPVPLPPFPRLPVDQAWEQHKRERRRSSVFDEDDNEIVLRCPRGLTSVAPDHHPEDSDTEKSLDMGSAHSEKMQPGSPKGKSLQTLSPDTRVAGTRCGPVIVSPSGEVLAEPGWDVDENIVVADVDFEDCSRRRFDLGKFGDFL